MTNANDTTLVDLGSVDEIEYEGQRAVQEDDERQARRDPFDRFWNP